MARVSGRGGSGSGSGRTWSQALKEQAALGSTYSRGSSLVRTGAVQSCQAYEDAGKALLAGTVRGSGSTYNVRVSLDLDGRDVTDHDCTCPAHANYAGMCKHTVALALNYLCAEGLTNVSIPNPTPVRHLDAPPVTPSAVGTVTGASGGGKAAPRPRQQDRPKDKDKPKDRPKPKPRPKTSPQIAKLINTYAEQAQAESRRLAAQASSAPDDPSAEPAELECIVRSAEATWRYAWSDDTWTLGLKVSRGKASYVVKSVEELVDAWHTGATVSYGKRLTFSHRPQSFSERANRLLELLSGVVEAQQSLYAAQESRSYSYSSYYYQNRMSAKTVPLSTAQLIEVLRVMEGAHVTYETGSYTRSGYRTERQRLLVVSGNPVPKVRIWHEEDGAYRLEVAPVGATCIGDERALCLVWGDTLHLCDEAFSHDLGVFLRSLLPMKEALTVREADMPGLCAAVLPALRRHAQLDAPDGIDAFMPPAAEFEFRIGLEDGVISCQATVLYGDERIPLYADVYQGQVVRHVEREMAAQALLRAYFPWGDHDTPNYGDPYPGTPPKRGRLTTSYGAAHEVPRDPWFDKDDDEAYWLLFSEGLDALGEMGTVYLSERLRDVRVRQAPAVRVEASVSGGLLDLGVASDDMDPSELMSYLASFRRKQRFVRLESGDIVRLDGSIATIEGLAEGLGISAEALVRGVEGIPANRTLFVDAMLKRAEGVSFARNAAFRQIVRDFETVADADFTVPASVTATLRPYQTDGFRWLCTLGKVGFGGILADDMGLGKTLQAISYLAYAQEQGVGLPSLVVCPASLVYNWAAELARFCPSLEVEVVVGTKRARTAAIGAAVDFDVLVTSYDLMRRDIEEYAQQRFHCAVLDEAHYIKNAGTQAARAAKRLVADVRLALTGTPIENRLSELWSIFDYLMPGVLGTHDAFAKRFSTPISGGDVDASERLRRLVSPFILRRLKRDVLRDLPDKSESVVTASLSGEQAKLYRASAQRLRMQVEHQLPEEFQGMRLQVLAELTKLRQICCDPSLAFEDWKGGSAKLDTCMELVQSALEGGHQMLVFSQFTSMLGLIAERLEGEGVGYLMLTGSTPKERRQRLVASFQAGEAPVFLISLKAGGVGLNLTAADIVIHYDPWWNVAAEDQATDRTHRIGQTREVSVFKLIAKDTIEEKIVEMQQAKRALADAVIGGEGVGSAAITREDILALLEG